MKKSDLPWILPLLTAVAAGKILQFRSGPLGPWLDWSAISKATLPSFNGFADDYRIKPELKLPVEVFTKAAYPVSRAGWYHTIHKQMETGIAAVLAAYKAGELDLTGIE